jgi:hypothetical protein
VYRINAAYPRRSFTNIEWRKKKKWSDAFVNQHVCEKPGRARDEFADDDGAQDQPSTKIIVKRFDCGAMLPHALRFVGCNVWTTSHRKTYSSSAWH